MLISLETQKLEFIFIVLTVIIAYNLGSIIAYFIGKKGGRKILERKDSELRKMALLKADNFFIKHGNKSLIIGKFIGYGRMFLPTVSGIFKINFLKFIIYNFIGFLLWVIVISSIIYILGTNGTIILSIIVLIISTIICIYLGYYIYFKTDFIKNYYNTGKLDFKLLVAQLEASDDKIVSKLKLDKKIKNNLDKDVANNLDSNIDSRQ